MDFNALQHKLFSMDPTDPAEDIRKMREVAGATPAPVETVNYVTESVEVPEGSLTMDKNYSVNDFAALAGVSLNETQKTGSAGQAKADVPMPAMSKPTTGNEIPHPLKDKLVGEDEIEECDEDRMRIDKLESRIQTLEVLVLKLAKERSIGEENKGLYHNVNKRKKAGTSRSADHPDAPSKQDWDNAAKTAKQNNSVDMDNIKNRLYDALNKKIR